MGMGGEGPPARFHVSLLCRNAVFTEMLPILFPENTQTQARGGGGGRAGTFTQSAGWKEKHACGEQGEGIRCSQGLQGTLWVGG